MSHINEKLGLKPASKRSMMKLPSARSDACALTAAQCPECSRRGVRQAAVSGVTKRICQWCSHVWNQDI